MSVPCLDTRFEHGAIVVVADGEDVVRLDGPRCEAVEIGDARSGLGPGTDALELDCVGGIGPGEQVEIRNEFRFGRANYPKVHAATVTSVEGNRIKFAPPVVGRDFENLRGSFVLRRLTTDCPQLVESARHPGQIRCTAAGDRASWEIEVSCNPTQSEILVTVVRRCDGVALIGPPLMRVDAW